MTEAPAVLVLTQHVYKGVHMEPGLPGADAEHHARPEYPLTHVNLPVEPAAIEDPRAPHPGGAIGPVGVKMGDPLLRPVQANLEGFISKNRIDDE